MNFFYSDRAAKAQVKYLTPESVVYSIGRYSVAVKKQFDPNDESAVTYVADPAQSGEPRRSLPNMEVRDGVLSIPLGDFLDEIMARATPLEIAQGLFEHRDVREHFVEAMADQWSQDHFDDTDRRRFLHQIQEAVHAKAADDLAGRIADMEWHNSQRFYHHSHTRDVNRWLADRGLDFRIPYEAESPDFKIGGKSWEEARNDWRELVLASFPAPAAPTAGNAEESK